MRVILFGLQKNGVVPKVFVVKMMTKEGQSIDNLSGIQFNNI